MNFDRDSVRQWANLIGISAAFITNTLTNILPPNGINIGDISNTVFKDVLIIPANYAFAIWGLIYLGLISLGIYQALPNQKTHPRLRQMGYGLAIASVFQILWVMLFQYRFFTLSILAMLGILIPLIFLYLRLNIALDPVSQKQRWLVNFPISIYLAWISVATIVNVASALYSIEWNGWGVSPIFWTVIMLFIGTILAIFVCLTRKDGAYVGVFIWAFVAIAIKHTAISIISITAIVLAIVLLLISVSRQWQLISR